MAMKEYFAFPKAPALLEPLHQNVSCHMQDTRSFLPLCRDAVGVSYNPNWQDKPGYNKSRFKIKALYHPEVTRFYHLVKSKHLVYMVEDIRKVRGANRVCAECKPKCCVTNPNKFIKAIQQFQSLSTDFKDPPLEFWKKWVFSEYNWRVFKIPFHGTMSWYDNHNKHIICDSYFPF